MAGFNGLTFAVVPVVTNTGSDAAPVWTLNTAGLAAGTVIAGILDPTNTQRIFDPIAEGNPVVLGTDTYSTWLPVVKQLSAAQVADTYWASIPGITANISNVGQVRLQLTPAAKNTVEASSLLTFFLSPRALIITATAGTF